MRLTDILYGVDIIREFQGKEELRPATAMEAMVGNYDVKELTADSRKCSHGCMFIAVKGAVADGGKFIGDAIAKGAQYIVCENIPESEEIPVRNGERDLIVYIVVKNSRQAEAQIALNYYNAPSEKLKLIGVTGTNGKTSIATLLYRMFSELGQKCGLVSTIANYIGDQKFDTINTTPGTLELNSLFARMVEQGCTYCFMEVSSHAIDQSRIAGLRFAGGIFTNLTQDHLDYHKTMQNYRDCKKRFFDSLAPEAFALTNIDDSTGAYMVQDTKAHIYTYSCKEAADYKTRILNQAIDGMELNINGTRLKCNFIGEYNAANLTAVYGAAILLGAPHNKTVEILSRLHPVAGRLEYHKGTEGIIAAVDYAHTPDALENVLKTLYALHPLGDLICVFGCGGDRDKTKRPKMGAIAGKYADVIYVTSDNPRTENPVVIIDDIKAGMSGEQREKSFFVPDRVEAINEAVMNARPGSIILIAGKGHEDYQIIGTTKHYMDDNQTVKKSFELRKSNSENR